MGWGLVATRVSAGPCVWRLHAPPERGSFDQFVPAACDQVQINLVVTENVRNWTCAAGSATGARRLRGNRAAGDEAKIAGFAT